MVRGDGDTRLSLDLFACELDQDAIAAGTQAVTRTRDALKANAIPRLAIEVMMLDLPQAGPEPLPVNDGAASGTAR